MFPDTQPTGSPLNSLVIKSSIKEGNFFFEKLTISVLKITIIVLVQNRKWF